ncbi:MAG: ribbon-helix-helix protein, CopG family [Alphaproteobacteria bacterium]|nr:MAG: ribbon-helix-helix protein, CopG family [Alphaproteobacteria bacterium]
MPKCFEPRLRAELLEGASCAPRSQQRKLTYVNSRTKVTHMEKTQIYFRKEELNALREAAARSGRSIAELVRDAVRKVVLKPPAAGPVAIWNGKPKRASVEHDSVHDKP